MTVALAQLPAVILGASAVVRLLLPAPFAVCCTSALLLSASTDSGAVARAGAFVLAGIEILLVAGLVRRATRRVAQLVVAIELVLVSMAAAALAQPELLWTGVGLAPLAFLVHDHLMLTLAAFADVLLLLGVFLVRDDSESTAP